MIYCDYCGRESDTECRGASTHLLRFCDAGDQGTTLELIHVHLHIACRASFTEKLKAFVRIRNWLRSRLADEPPVEAVEDAVPDLIDMDEST